MSHLFERAFINVLYWMGESRPYLKCKTCYKESLHSTRVQAQVTGGGKEQEGYNLPLAWELTKQEASFTESEVGGQREQCGSNLKKKKKHPLDKLAASRQ